MEKISRGLKNYLDKELSQLLTQYEKRRLALAKEAEAGFDISFSLEEEVWERKIKFLKNLMKNKEIISFQKKGEEIVLGSYVTINFQGFKKSFILDGVGYKKDDIIIISSKSPIGSILLGKKRGETILFQGKTIKIETVSFAW
ncbi:MAG: Transcription elongation factor, GreA/GreB, C-term [Patescibacteria group bacterium]|nr:Transcription elongation factor, GreA/GreB, C-term [Patescibacteria group bacterium]